MYFQDTREFGNVPDAVEIPELSRLQRLSYEKFLQAEADPAKRKKHGLEGLLQEIFPIVSYDENMHLEYLSYDLGRPRYSPDECRQLRLTYGVPFRIRCRMTRKDKNEIMEDSVYLGELPVMIGGGEFIINGAERVIVNQLHRSPGVDFIIESQEGDRPLHGCRVIPERGSWIEINITKKDVMVVRIDQSSKLSATTFLRAMDEKYSKTEDIIREFHPTKNVAVDSLKAEMWVVGPVVDKKTGEVIVKAGCQVGDELSQIQQSALKRIEIVDKLADAIIMNSLAEDPCEDHEQALLRIYSRLRPGNPAQLDKAKTLFKEKFYDANRYRLGKVGRFRLNRKFKQNVSEEEMTLRAEDFLNSLKYLFGLRNGQGYVDDIDHLGNRRLRTIDELATDELRKGFLKLRRAVQERMSMKDPDTITRVAELVNSKSISSSIDFFFGRGELSQVVDQTNPLSQLTHERRLSALGPGGLNRKRAGFEVRDVHISHYGRICPIETPEGTNIGLIASLGVFADIDEYGFLITPYQKVQRGKVTDVEYLRADQEMEAILAPTDVLAKGADKLEKGPALARVEGDLAQVDSTEIEYVDVSSKQTVGVSAALIPFLEHDDANRALMGSNMQRQAVPLLQTQPPIVATGMEKIVAQNSSMVIRAEKTGTITAVDAQKIVIDNSDEYVLRKFVGLNERTCLNQKSIVKLAQRVKKGEVIADGAGTCQGELALGRNILVGFMMFDGYNFEDAILISEKLVKDDIYTSIHIEEYDVEIRETKLGREEFTCDIPNVSEKALARLDEGGVVQVGTNVKAGDILVGKISPKSKSELSPEEKLLYAIFGRAGEDVKNDSLELPSGQEGIVIDAKRFSRRMYMSDEQRKAHNRAIKEFKQEMSHKCCDVFRQMSHVLTEKLSVVVVDPLTRQKMGASDDDEVIAEQVENFEIGWIKPAAKREAAEKVINPFLENISKLQEQTQRKLQQMKRGDELPSGVLEMVKIYVATKRRLAVGDKMAGRHGNKGVIARILPEEDMPFLEDGTPLDVLLNPLGVPSRMNVGQILETHLGWAANILGFQALIPVFDGAGEEEIREVMQEANDFIQRGSGDNPPDIPFSDFLDLLEGAIMLKHPDPDNEGYGETCVDLPYFNDKRPKFQSISVKINKNDRTLDDESKNEYNKVVNQTLNKHPYFKSLLDSAYRSFPNEWCPAEEWKKVPTKPGIYLFRQKGKIIYVGKAGPRVSGKDLQERLGYHCVGNGESSFRKHIIKYVTGDEKRTKKPLDEYLPGIEFTWIEVDIDKVQQKPKELPPEFIKRIQDAGETGELFIEMPLTGKLTVYDGRTGEPFDQKVAIGYMYLMKLHHLVDDKIHARATGPYSLITQQPLGGKARTGGQRFGEMEVWGLEAYGTAYILQELLTVKSDDVEGRTKIYQSMVKGLNCLEAGTPVSFDVLCNEIRGLGLNIQLEKKRII